MAKLVRIDRNGTKYFEGDVPCTRCDGMGYYVIGVCNNQPVLSPVDNGVCFKCGGSGKQFGKWKEYTPEHEAKLAERRAKRKAKYKAEREAYEAEREAERLRKEAEAKAEAERIQAEKAKSQYVGSVGERLTLKAIYVKTAWYEKPAYMGYGTETAYIHTFKAGDNSIVWKTTSALGWWNDKDEWETLEEGQEVTIKGTVKEHSTYKDEKQTVLTRCKVTG